MTKIIGRIVPPNLSGAPSAPSLGEMYFDIPSSVLFWWNGTKWLSGSGGAQVDISTAGPSPRDQQLLWVDTDEPAATSGLVPTGGTAPQALVKTSSTDYAAAWKTRGSGTFRVAADSKAALNTAIPGLSIALTTLGGAVLIQFWTLFINSTGTGQTPAVVAFRDGTNINGGVAQYGMNVGNGVNTPIVGHWLDAPAAGAHTYTFGCASGMDGTGSSVFRNSVGIAVEVG